MTENSILNQLKNLGLIIINLKSPVMFLLQSGYKMGVSER